MNKKVVLKGRGLTMKEKHFTKRERLSYEGDQRFCQEGKV
jgi:hypothetical protein